MGKLGKKARKFAKKNLQSVLKRKRQLKSMFKKKASKRDEQVEAENLEEDQIGKSSGRDLECENIEDFELDAVFSDKSDVVEDDSESDGYLSEGSSCPYTDENGTESDQNDMDVDNGGAIEFLEQNRAICIELTEKKKKLERLQKKDLEFSKFLESYENGLGKLRDDENYSDEDNTSEDGTESPEKGTVNLRKGKLLTSSAFNSLCQLVKERHSISALTSLLNEYRAACHYGSEPSDLHDVASCSGLQDSKTFSKILIFMLQEADNIFREMLGISSSSCKKEAILELKNSSKWKTMKPLIKSYLRSTLFLLNQVTNSEILAFSLVRVRASVIFFATFHLLLRRLIKIAVHLWVTGEGTLASYSFLVIKDVASVFSSDCFSSCLIKTYKAFITHCKFVDPVSSKHIQFLHNSFIELCSQDVQNSSRKAMVCVEQLSKILQTGLKTKKKQEAVKRICSWQYTNCINLWVSFISANVKDYDLQPLLYMIIHIINGVAVLFPGPRYLPLRIKCIQWLNNLSSASGVFIPIASFAMDILEYKTGKDNGKPGKDFNFSSTIKLPKHWLKSRKFQDKCVSSVIELLAAHFAQWSCHITFPELATIPLICLRKFLETTTIEHFQRVVKRFVDQVLTFRSFRVEQNIEFMQGKRDEVAFSPKDHQIVDSFLQFEKSNANASFTQYYNSIIEKAASSKPVVNQKISYYFFLVSKEAKKKRKRAAKQHFHLNAIDEVVEEKKKSTDNGGSRKMRKKRKN
ncbi:nucleolar complex protein 2-like protein isoform X2 [Gossypium australe]|uniref:Nucleolar complex protein 2-like protein isoform X2 n=1 Tax=Gossypium australe TaxID=47621 RepID=A0A5B6UXL9_9ROSI|nr:nucleolar complex protein 2-like protein isoform X2 [Gossypium australe]